MKALTAYFRSVGTLATLALASLGVAAQITVAIDVTSPSCAGYTDGRLEAVASGGTAPYAYAWTDGAAGAFRYSIADGTYGVTVTDATGATATSQASIASPSALGLAVTASDVCAGTTGTYTLSANGGTPPYTYTWDGQASGAVVTNPTAGYHSATVTDANGCRATAGAQVTAPLAATVRVQDLVCNGGCDGTVEAVVAGGTAPFAFAWSNGATDQLVYGLDPGTYTVVVTDALGCTATAAGTVREPDALSVAVSLQDSCVGTTQATAVAQGGTGQLTIRWSNGETGDSATLPEGQWYVNVEDENGCEVTERVIVSDGIEAVVTMNVDATCDSLGSSLLCITGGRGPFTYIWSDGQREITATGLEPGVYSYTIIDGGGCRFDGSTVINGPDPASCDGCDADAGTLSGGTTLPPLCDTTYTLVAGVATAPTVPAGFEVVYVLTTAPNATIVATSPNPSFDVSAPGTYTIHTLVYDPATLDLSTVVIGQTMADDIVLLLVQGGGPVCGALDRAGTTFTVPVCPDPLCDADAGTLTGGSTLPPLCDTTYTLTATVAAAPVVPAGFSVVYVLTGAPDATILAASPTPSFDVDSAGVYTIHTLVYDPATLDLSVVVFGQTTAADVLALLTQGGGAICAALDVTGATFTVPECPNPLCEADAGSLAGGTTLAPICDTTYTLDATVATAPTVPAGFSVVYVLTAGPNATILATSPTPSFAVDSAGVYTIHTLVYDPATLDLTLVVPGQTTAAAVAALLQQGGGAICGALDLAGTTFNVPECDDFGCTGGTTSALASQPVCFDGASAELVPDILTPATVPAGFTEVYILSLQPAGTIVAVSATPQFTVTAAGEYVVRSLVYATDSLDLNAVIQLGTTTLAELTGALTDCDNLDPAGAVYAVEPFAPAFANGLAEPVCAGESATLNPGGDTTLAYAWEPADLLDDPTAASPVATITEAVQFTVTLSRVIGGVECTAVATYDVNVAAPPTLATDPEIVTCQGGTVDLDAGASAGSTVEWSEDQGFASIAATGQTFTVVSGAPTRYYVRATNAAGCTATSSVTVGDYPVTADLGDDLSVCAGDEAPIEVAATSGSPVRYVLRDGTGAAIDSNAVGQFTIIAQEAATYSVTATNAEGCTGSDEIGVDVSEVDVQLLAGAVADTAIYPGNSVDLTASSGGATGFMFDTDASFLATGDSSATVMPEQTTTYTVTATNELGCMATASLTVEILDFACDRPFLFVPNAFTPDRDNLNDVFYIDGVNVREAYYAIYNRWGEQVFESSVIGNEGGWSGEHRGQLVDPDVYGIYVRILCNDGEEFYTQGNVTVIR